MSKNLITFSVVVFLELEFLKSHHQILGATLKKTE